MFFFLFLLTFRVLTINIRGLGGVKLDLIADLVNKSDIDVCFIQETQISHDNVIRSLSSRWRGSSFWSPSRVVWQFCFLIVLRVKLSNGKRIRKAELLVFKFILVMQIIIWLMFMRLLTD